MRWVLLLLACGNAFADEIAYPNDYRHWTHVKSAQIRSGHPLYYLFGGIHHIYANKQALEGLKKGKFANGSTLVLDLLEARDDGYSVAEGPRKLLAVMHKDLKRFPATGGWGFEAFRADSRKERTVGGNAAVVCFECHASQRSRDFVFSALRP
jgi:hypothetical protein